MSRQSMVAMDLFQKEQLLRLLDTQVIAEEYVWYVVKSRILILFGICLFSCIRWKKLFVLACLFLLGFGGGAFIVSAVLQLGGKGILLCVAGIFPQMVFYGMMYGILFLYWFRYPKGEWNRMKWICCAILFVLGLTVEIYINPIIVKVVVRML